MIDATKIVGKVNTRRVHTHLNVSQTNRRDGLALGTEPMKNDILSTAQTCDTDEERERERSEVFLLFVLHELIQ